MWFVIAAALAAEPPPGGWPPPPKTSTVASVYDGDTLTLETGDKIRLRWVNTPELKPPEAYGIEARDATEQFLRGKAVTLLLASDNPRDGYGRVVAGIRTDEGDLSVHLLELGLAHLFVIPPDDTDLKPMLAAQARAKADHRGIWSTDRYQGTLHITSFHANAPGDDRTNVNGEYLRVANVSVEPVSLEGYTIKDASGRSWALPAVVVPAGHTFKILSGIGPHQTNPASQLEVYLGSSEPVWNNDGDRATILDPLGRVMDARAHEGSGSKK